MATTTLYIKCLQKSHMRISPYYCVHAINLPFHLLPCKSTWWISPAWIGGIGQLLVQIYILYCMHTCKELRTVKILENTFVSLFTANSPNIHVHPRSGTTITAAFYHCPTKHMQLTVQVVLVCTLTSNYFIMNNIFLNSILCIRDQDSLIEQSVIM